MTTLVVVGSVVALPAAPPAAAERPDPPDPPATLAHEHRVVGENTIESEFPIDFVGVLSDGQSAGGGAVRFRRDARWGPWLELEPDGVETPDTWASGLAAGGGAEAFQVRLSGGTEAARAIVINTTDGPAEPATVAAAACADQTATVTRCEWGADESLMSWAPEYYPPQKFTVHHTATSNGAVDPAATVRAIYRYHAVDRGFGDIGYQYLIDESGRVYEGRYSGTDTEPGHDGTGSHVVTAAHVGGFNSGNTGIALIGTLTSVPAAPAARGALETLLGELTGRHQIDPHGAATYVNPVNGVTKTLPNISGHRDWAATECPGERLYTELPAVRDAAAGGTPNPDTTPPVVSGVNAATTSTGATIRWTTNEAATSVVEHRLRSGSTWLRTEIAGLVTDHAIVLTGLIPRTRYQYRVTSADAAGNTTTSPTASFTTKRAQN